MGRKFCRDGRKGVINHRKRERERGGYIKVEKRRMEILDGCV